MSSSVPAIASRTHARGQRIPSLDGFRAIAISLVLLGHASDTMPEAVSHSYEFLHKGSLGVMIFFVISGYLITRLMISEYGKTGTVSLKDFYIRRVFRIFPAFYTYWGTIVLLVAFGALVMRPQTLINAAFFVTNYKHYWTTDDGPNYWFVGHFWTLSIEEQFYLLWPAIFCFLGLRRALPAAIVMICAIEPLRVVSYYFDVHSRGQIDMMLHTSLDCIMVGCVLALIENNNAFRRLFALLTNGWLAVLALLYFVAPSFAYLLLGKYASYYYPTLGRFFTLFWIAVLVIWGVKNEQTVVGRLLNLKPLVYVGTLSYSLYLWQQLFLTPLNTTWMGRFPQNLVCTFIAAQLSYSCIEKPFLRLREKHFKRPVKLPTGQVVSVQ